MTRRVVTLLTVFAFLMAMTPSFAGGPWPDTSVPSTQTQPTQLPGYQFGQFDQSQQQQHGSGLFSFLKMGTTGKKIANIALTAAGTVVAGLFGSQFGIVGTVIGGAAGLLISRWIANKLFPTDSLVSGCQYGQQYWTGGSQYSQTNPGWNPGTSHNGTGSGGDLKDLQHRFVSTYNAFKAAIASGDKNAETNAKAAYDQAREAYYSAKNGSFR